MKIIIIALPRSGSTSLMLKMSSENKLEDIFEPWETPWDNKKIRKKYDPTQDNIVIKTTIDYLPDDIDLSKFDKIVLLSRRDLKSCWESWAHLKHNYKIQTSSEKYYYSKPPNVEWAIDDIKQKQSKLEQLSKKINVPITYYEDIYDVNSPERLRQTEPNGLPIKKTNHTII